MDRLNQALTLVKTLAFDVTSQEGRARDLNPNENCTAVSYWPSREDFCEGVVTSCPSPETGVWFLPSIQSCEVRETRELRGLSSYLKSERNPEGEHILGELNQPAWKGPSTRFELQTNQANGTLRLISFSDTGLGKL